jgi:hypothetical protein
LCRKQCAIDYAFIDEDEDLFDHLYRPESIVSPMSIDEVFNDDGDDYQPTTPATPIEPVFDSKKELKRWLTSTGFRARCRSTESYCSMKRRDRVAFCRQMKDVFRHILKEFAPNDAETVWEDLIDHETKKPTEIGKK